MFQIIYIFKKFNSPTFFVRLIVACTIATLFSCESFVDLELPDSQLNTQDVFNDIQTAEGAIGELYSKLRDESLLTGDINGIGVLLGLYSDELTNFNPSILDRQEFYLNSVLPTNSYIENWWQSSYNLIYSCNRAMEGLENSSGIPKEKRDQLIGEVKFLRSLLYYYLTRIYGEVPYTLSTDYEQNTSLLKTGKDDLLAFLTTDLLSAEELLPQTDLSGDRIYPTKAAAQVVLSRIYLERNDPEMAEVYTTKLIENPEYDINIPIETVFLKSSPSTIWQLKSSQSGNNTLEAMTYIFATVPPPNIALSEYLINSFDPKDLRLQEWVQKVGDSTNVFYYSYKYRHNEPGPDSQEYSIIFRLSEMYLIRAEARFALGKKESATEDLNIIRNRARLGNLNANELIKEQIAQEWYHEYFTEFGHRFISLKRLQLLDVILGLRKAGWNPEDKLLPLPESDLLINPNLEPQNIGY